MAFPFAEATQTAYEQQDVDALRLLLDRADSMGDSLLVRYRLFPLTEDERVLRNLPTTLENGNSQELALLSALWAYRAGEGSWLSAIRRGRRSTTLLEKAKALNPTNPFVLLVEGQSLLFRPAIAGRDPTAAAHRFSELARIAADNPSAGISPVEAQMWLWLALREADRDTEAETLRRQLRERSIASLYRQFLDAPPEV